MANTHITLIRKRPVNLSLSEDLLAEAKSMTDNLSAVVEALLVDYIAKQHHEREQVQQNADAVAIAWNSFNERNGSFADEYSTL